MLYLHYGWPRTSTSSLQAALFEHRAQLAAASTVFPQRWMTMAGPTHHGLSELMRDSMGSADSFDEIRDFLRAHASAPRYQYRNRWTAGDLVVWDNRAVWHCAVDDYGDAERWGYKTAVIGAGWFPSP